MKLLHNSLAGAPSTRHGNQSVLVVLVAVVFASSVILTAAGRSQASLQAAHQDIREIFLSVPIPQNYLEYFAVAKVLGDSRQRKVLLEKTDFTLGDNVLDVPTGYLRIDFQIPTEDEPSPRRIVVTYFTKGNGDRLVVVQLEVNDHPDPELWDAFYLVANGTYTLQQDSQVLPPIASSAISGQSVNARQGGQRICKVIGRCQLS
jgi:hypothetical protein